MHRRSYRDEPALADEVFALLGRVFPGEPLDRARLAFLRFGAPWASASTPYSVPLEPSEGGGTVLMARGPLPIDGRPLRLGRGGRC